MANRKPQPQIFSVKYIVEQATTNLTSSKVTDKWIPARPIACPTLWEKIILAWMVFCGKGDVLVWTDEEVILPNRKKEFNEVKAINYAQHHYRINTSPATVNMSSEGMTAPVPTELSPQWTLIHDAYKKGWDDCNEA